jgi:hypothetical protein
MIPHSRLSDEIFGLRERVSACRKRVRLSRTKHKPITARNQSEGAFPEADSAAFQPGRYTEDYSIAQGLVGEQEVGIT